MLEETEAGISIEMHVSLADRLNVASAVSGMASAGRSLANITSHKVTNAKSTED